MDDSIQDLMRTEQSIKIWNFSVGFEVQDKEVTIKKSMHYLVSNFNMITNNKDHCNGFKTVYFYFVPVPECKSYKLYLKVDRISLLL